MPVDPRMHQQGASEDEAISNIGEAIVGCLEVRSAAHMPLTVRTVELDVAVG